MMTDDQNGSTWKRDDEPESERPGRQESPREFGNRESPLGDPDPSNIDDPTLESSAATEDKKLIPSDTGFRHIGPYKILSTVGEGGMGIVFRAFQTDPIRRDVAVKIIKLGMNTREIIARFESERQALALMDHPNIARILGAGTTEDGRLYFAMEYVKGIPLSEYCDKQRLGIRKRLDLFKRICLAVQHAHQKAILHRDLKPSNILVTDQQGDPVPKIIDFGLAKALGGQRLTEQTFFTAQGVMMGTPEYMSPEQADPSALDIDTRTDIYSLGVILYQLLAGVLPIEIKDRRVEAIRRSVCDEEPQKPSTRIGNSPDLGSQAAALHQMDHSSLIRRLKGDLDWITMKALEKDRNRRYATASDLAADIERHLNHEPVSAGPPSGAYILKKFVRKHVGLVASLAVVIIALVAGGGTATVYYWKSEEALKGEGEARRAAEIRREEAERERTRAQDAEERERGERKKAETARTLAQDAQKEAIRERKEANQARSVAQERLDEILRLSDIKKLSELRDRADRLWPADPEKVKGMEAWLADARELEGNLNEHRQTLVDLRKDAVAKSQGCGYFS